MKISPPASPTSGEESITLETVCQKLEKILRISKLEPSDT
jgi:hypothetical protein